MNKENSMSIVLPSDIVKQKKIKEEDKVVVELNTKAGLRSVFGSLHRKLSGQKFKDIVRQGWDG